jgi:IclR family acetate operon transcriptional repressor
MNESARRTLQIIEYLAERGPTGLSRMASDLSLNKSTAHRFLATLVEAGFARRDGNRSYTLTTKVVGLGSKVLDRIEIRDEVRPHLERLSALTSETAHLAILEDWEIVYIDKVDGQQAVTMASRIGGRGHCHSTALGKVLLADLPQEAWTRYVKEKGLGRRTPNTIVEPARLRPELAVVRERGYAVDDAENEQGIRCVAAPVRDHDGDVVAAMSISGWTVSMTTDRIPELVPIVARHAERASRALGYGSSEPAPPRT